jgi:hypothetical protein
MRFTRVEPPRSQPCMCGCHVPSLVGRLQSSRMGYICCMITAQALHHMNMGRTTRTPQLLILYKPDAMHRSKMQRSSWSSSRTKASTAALMDALLKSPVVLPSPEWRRCFLAADFRQTCSQFLCKLGARVCPHVLACQLPFHSGMLNAENLPIEKHGIVL